MKHLTCMICTEAYDSERVVPLNFRQCGHTFCRACVVRLVEGQVGTKKARIQCPKCRAIQNFCGKFKKIEDEFPKNYLFFESLTTTTDRKPTEEVKEEPPGVELCVDPCCPDKRKQNIVSAEHPHPNCDKEMRINARTFDKCEFATPATVLEFDPEAARAEVRTQVRKLEATMNELVDCATKVITDERKFLEKAQKDFSFFASNLGMFSAEKTAGKALRLSLANHKDLLNFARNFKRHFDEFFRQKVGEICSVLSKEMVIENINSFAAFNEPVFLRNRDLLVRMRMTNPRLLKDMLLGGWTPTSPFFLEDVFAVIRESYTTIPEKFALEESSNRLSRDNDTVRFEIRKAFSYEGIYFRAVETRLHEQLNRNEQRGQWTVTFSMETYKVPKGYTIFWTVFSQRGFYITASLAALNPQFIPARDSKQTIRSDPQRPPVQQVRASNNQSHGNAWNPIRDLFGIFSDPTRGP